MSVRLMVVRCGHFMSNFPSVHEVFEDMTVELWTTITSEEDWYAKLGEELPDGVYGGTAGGVIAVLVNLGPAGVAVRIHQVHFACVRE